jgi:hypothetical protein
MRLEIDRFGRVDRVLMREHGLAGGAVRHRDLAAKGLLGIGDGGRPETRQIVG